ncbi:MAG TPA: hypothetical protein VGH08_04555 [Chthoniobacterales bacterium]
MFTIVPLLLLALYPPPNKELHVASSAEDPFLVARIKGLSSTVSADDARRVASCAYTTGLELRREWHVSTAATLLPGLQNLFIKMGARKGGYCFQYSAQLLVRLDAMKLQTLELHWAESQLGTMSENNAIVVTARGQPFEKGVLLDNWRCQGHLAWTQVTMDPEYRWKESKSFAALVLRRPNQDMPANQR